MATDQCGYELTGATGQSAQRYDDAVRSLLAWSDDLEDAWEATVAEDPGFAMGQIGNAYLCCLSSEGPDAAQARALLEALGVPEGLTDRERRHLDAATAYAHGDLAGAAARLSALSVEYPLDALALAVGHQLDFFRGDAAGLRDRPGGTLLAWDREHPLFGFVLGMHAFGLEESNLYPQAEDAGMGALEAEPRDVWALHAVVHVREMQGRADEGLRFMDQRRADWDHGNVFHVHNAWHEALFRLELDDIDGALQIYDGILHHDGSDGVALEMLDAASLLWRLHLDGVAFGDRWEALADAWAAKADAPWYVFNDLHATLSFVGAGRLGEARELVERLRSYVANGASQESNLAMTAEVGLPVCEAVVAFGEERYADVIDLLVPIRHVLHCFGGSNAQRDVVARTLLEASIRDGREALARSLLSERLARRPTSTYDRRQLERIGAAERAVAAG